MNYFYFNFQPSVYRVISCRCLCCPHGKGRVVFEVFTRGFEIRETMDAVVVCDVCQLRGHIEATALDLLGEAATVSGTSVSRDSSAEANHDLKIRLVTQS